MVRLVIAPEEVAGDGWGWWHLTTLWRAESAGGHPKGPAAFLAPHSETEEKGGRERRRVFLCFYCRATLSNVDRRLLIAFLCVR